MQTSDSHLMQQYLVNRTDFRLKMYLQEVDSFQRCGAHCVGSNLASTGCNAIGVACMACHMRHKSAVCTACG